MSFIFVGGEDHQFAGVGTVAVDTTAGHFRSAYARSALKITSNAGFTDGWQATIAASSTFWFSGQAFAVVASPAATTGAFVQFMDGTVRRLWITTDGASAPVFRLNKRDASGTVTVLATSSTSVSFNTLLKLDVYVDYAVAGRVKFYVNGALVIDYSGDITTNSSTALTGFNLGNIWRNSAGTQSCSWSEIIVSTYDTRGMGLSTLVPLAAGNAQTWSGAVGDVNESTLNDATMISTTAVDQLAQFTVTPLSSITATAGVRAVIVTARAAKGASGPANIQGVVRTSSTDYVSGTIALPSSFGPIQAVFETNPNTGLAWTGAQVSDSGFNVGAKSIT